MKRRYCSCVEVITEIETTEKSGEIIEGDVRKFCVINSTNYNKDEKYCVQVVGFNELKNLGFEEYDLKYINRLNVDGEYQTDFEGCYVIRVA